MEVTVNNWNDFLKKAEEIAESLRNGNKDQQLWYRGHHKIGYKLQPSLLRYHEGVQQEEKLFEKYKETLDSDESLQRNPWAILLEMQHYRVPTRLLDWTEVLGVAVYFAITPKFDEACIYILNPFELDRISRGPDQDNTNDRLIKVPNGDDSFNFDILPAV
ncbi:MAG TPA: hypothetical protein DCF68_05935, partial [Cyanothece sp. UBA12306]|nr:hypothetical protein [Cyanothece sp. UBA12306]